VAHDLHGKDRRGPARQDCQGPSARDDPVKRALVLLLLLQGCSNVEIRDWDVSYGRCEIQQLKANKAKVRCTWKHSFLGT
jgi:hypothetical protein